MHLVTFRTQDGEHRLGVLSHHNHQEVIVDLHQADPHLPVTLLEFLREGEEALNRARRIRENVPDDAVHLTDTVALGTLIPHPGKIICIGLNYRDHAEEAHLPLPEVPVVFAKYANTLIGPFEAIVLPRTTQEVDYEAELACVIGRRGKYIPATEAMQYIAGYTIFNDVSARDYQMRTSQWTMGKTCDTFGPLGPALVTSDEITDPHVLAIRLSINGEVMQDSNTRHLIFSLPSLIAYLSSVMTLEPGDIIATGTPAGVGFIRHPPRFLHAGDTVRIEIEGIGVLENPVRAEEG